MIDGEWNPPREISEISWTNIKDVWLPLRVEARDTLADESQTIVFDWVSVNEPIPERVFTQEGLNLEQGTVIADRRLGDKPIVVAVVGHNTAMPQLPIPPATPNSSWTGYVVVGGSLLACSLLALLWWQRTRQRA